MVKGKRYYPKDEPGYDRQGVASWYGAAFRGRRTANGELYDPDHLPAAHPTLPLPSYVRVTNLDNGSSVIVRFNDRGPYHKGRLIDVSSKAADLLALKDAGTASVRVQYVGRANLHGDDMAFLAASLVAKRGYSPASSRRRQTANKVLVASASSATEYASNAGHISRSQLLKRLQGTHNRRGMILRITDRLVAYSTDHRHEGIVPTDSTFLRHLSVLGPKCLVACDDIKARITAALRSGFNAFSGEDSCLLPTRAVSGLARERGVFGSVIAKWEADRWRSPPPLGALCQRR